jgi:hypothetical protein
MIFQKMEQGWIEEPNGSQNITRGLLINMLMNLGFKYVFGFLRIDCINMGTYAKIK